MSIIYRCDRCHSDHTNENDVKEHGFVVWEYNIFMRSTKYIMLCNDCIKKLTEFLRPLPLEAEKTEKSRLLNSN